jgi:type II secretory pathway pseudopilin PulG
MSKLRGQDGFTLPEMLTALIVGMIVVSVALGLLDFTIRRSGEIAGRVEASQKGRAAMDTMTQHLRSQVCLNSTTPPIATGDGTSVSFYTDLTDGSAGAPPERHVMNYDPAKRLLTEADYFGTRAGSNVIYPALPSRQRRLSANVVPDGSPAPIFKYYAYDTTVTPPRCPRAPSRPTRPRAATWSSTTTCTSAPQTPTIRVTSGLPIPPTRCRRYAYEQAPFPGAR